MNRHPLFPAVFALVACAVMTCPAGATLLFTVDTDGGGSIPGPYQQDASIPTSTLTTTYDSTTDYNFTGKGATPDEDGDGSSNQAFGGNAGNINNGFAGFADGSDWIQFEIAVNDDVEIDMTQLYIDCGDFGSGGRPDGLELSMAIAVNTTGVFDASTPADDTMVSPDGESPVGFTFDLTGYAALQDLGAGDTVYVRALMYDNGTSSYSQGFDRAEFSGEVTESVVPEPTALALLGLGAFALGTRRS